MRWTWEWRRHGRLPPIPELVRAERFVGEAQPVRDAELFLVAALFACEHRWTVSWERFDVRRFACEVVSPGFDGDAAEWDRLFDALAVFFGWLHALGEIDASARGRLVRECAAQRETGRAMFPA